MYLALVICVMMCILSREQTQHVLIRSLFFLFPLFIYMTDVILGYREVSKGRRI